MRWKCERRSRMHVRACAFASTRPLTCSRARPTRTKAHSETSTFLLLVLLLLSPWRHLIAVCSRNLLAFRVHQLDRFLSRTPSGCRCGYIDQGARARLRPIASFLIFACGASFKIAKDCSKQQTSGVASRRSEQPGASDVCRAFLDMQLWSRAIDT